jgi:hypothetical protein
MQQPATASHNSPATINRLLLHICGNRATAFAVPICRDPRILRRRYAEAFYISSRLSHYWRHGSSPRHERSGSRKRDAIQREYGQYDSKQQRNFSVERAGSGESLFSSQSGVARRREPGECTDQRRTRQRSGGAAEPIQQRVCWDRCQP